MPADKPDKKMIDESQSEHDETAYDADASARSEAGRLRRLMRRMPMPLLVIAGGVLVFSLLMASKPETKPNDRKERVWSVAARTVAYDIYEPSISVFGELRAKREVRLRALVSGEVVETDANFEDGARVSKGDLLLTIDPFNYETRLDEAKAQMKGAQALLTERKAAVSLAYQDYKRAKQLFDKGTVSKKTLDDRKTDHTIKKARRDQQQSVVDRLAVQVKRAQRDLDNTKVVAPFDGYLTAISARSGRVLNPNDQIAVLFDADNFEVVFNLSDAEYGRFLQRNAEIIGRSVQIAWDVGGERINLAAVIKRVGAQISQTTRGFDVYAEVEGPLPSNVRGGAFVSVNLTAQPIPDVMALPKDALYGDNRAYRIVAGRLEPVQLDDFIDDGKNILLRSGLDIGEQILLTRFNEAAPGVAVKVMETR